jgi:menaquinone-dependent protoporphyrinogen oxidase
MSAMLVAFGSKYGSTAAIAEAIGQRLRERGHTVDVRPAGEVEDLGRFDAFVVGGGLYMGGWHKEAMNLLKRHEAELRQRPTWLFSSGPTGGSPEADAAVKEALSSPTTYPPVKDVARRMERIGARGHATFPGSVGEGVGGIFARWVPKGDWRDFDAIRDWADTIGAELSRAPDLAVA